MHVMMVVAEMRSGGAEQVVAALARNILAGQGELTLASSGGWRASQLEEVGARPIFVPLRGHRVRDLVLATIALRRELARTQVDVIHAHNVKAAGVSAAASPRRGCLPLVVTLHGVANTRYRAAARILLRCADELVAVSDHVADRITAAGFPATRVRVIENAVAPPEHHPREDARARLGLPRGIPVAVCIARLAAQKRHDLLVDAWRTMPRDAVLLVAGDGPMRSVIESAVRHTRQAERIRLLGERWDVDWLLAASDLCVLPTDWEGLPVSVLEAMAARVPVVASAVGGVAELGAAVELVTPGSAAALASGMYRVLDDAELRRRMVCAGAALISGRFAPERMWTQYRGLYENVLDPTWRSADAGRWVGSDHE